MSSKDLLYNNENIKYLENWLNDAKSIAKNLSEKSKSENLLSIFTISSTVKVTSDKMPYLTPLRSTVHGNIGGAVVFSQFQASLLCKIIDGMVDLIFVDAEKKIGITLGIDKKAINYFKIKGIEINNKSRVPIEMGNLSSACSSLIKKSQFQEYKPNDLTVDTVWSFLSNKFKVLSSKKIVIIGSGNIGFKLALKLVESGSSVELVRRDLEKGTLMAKTIDIVKPKTTIASANYNRNALQASLFSDVLIGCTNGVPAISWDMIQSMNKNGIIIDVGKGSISKDVASLTIKESIPIYRCDISPSIDGLISTVIRNKQIFDNELGRKEIFKNIFIISGGQFGIDGDIVVDNYKNPKNIIGVADGEGDIKSELNKEDKNKLIQLKSFIDKNVKKY